jgi:hypothetical protein
MKQKMASNKGMSTKTASRRPSSGRGAAPAAVARKKMMRAKPAGQEDKGRVKVLPASRNLAEDVLAEVKALRETVIGAMPKPILADNALEDGVDSIRRLLSELMEARMEAVIRGLAAVRSLAAGKGADAELLAELDRLLGEAGATKFEATPMDFVDSLIYTVAAERHQPDAPEGVVLGTIQPGFRTGRGIVVAKAGVCVNRRQ